MLQKKLGKRIAEMRRNRQMTQAGLAKRAGYSVEFISLVERGVNGPSIAGLEKFAKALKVEIVDLFTFTGRNLPGVKRIITVVFGLAALVLSVICGMSTETILSKNESLFTQCGAIMIRSNTLPIASGFVLGPQKDVVTCWHVLEGARSLYHDTNLVFISGQGINDLKLKYVLPKYDLAVFSASPPINGTPFKAGDYAKLNEGDTIIYMGFDPKQSSTVETRTEIAYAWAVKKASGTNNNVKVDSVLFVGETGPGWSGGPVFNTNLEVVAVITGHGRQNVVVANSIAPVLDYEKLHTYSNASPPIQPAPH